MAAMFKNILGDLGGQAGLGGGQGGDSQMNDLFKQFSTFLSQGDGEQGDSEFAEAMNSAFKEVLSKENLYEPMKNLREAYPEWLEKNWETISQEDLERYNK